MADEQPIPGAAPGKDLTPAAQENLQKWIQALQQQNQQFGSNADLGRTGVKGVPAKED